MTFRMKLADLQQVNLLNRKITTNPGVVWFDPAYAQVFQETRSGDQAVTGNGGSATPSAGSGRGRLRRTKAVQDVRTASTSSSSSSSNSAASNWSAQPTGSHRRQQPQQPRPDGPVSFTGVVDWQTGYAHLCPLVASRGSQKYQGPLSLKTNQVVRDLRPIDHYQTSLLNFMVRAHQHQGVWQGANRSFGNDFLDAGKRNKDLVSRVMTRPTLGIHRGLPTGMSKSDTVAGAHKVSARRTPDTLDYWDTAGHRTLVRRLRLQPEACVGFAVQKNGVGPGIHKVYFVSRLNVPFFGGRGMSQRYAEQIVKALQRIDTWAGRTAEL